MESILLGKGLHNGYLTFVALQRTTPVCTVRGDKGDLDGADCDFQRDKTGQPMTLNLKILTKRFM